MPSDKPCPSHVQMTARTPQGPACPRDPPSVAQGWERHHEILPRSLPRGVMGPPDQTARQGSGFSGAHLGLPAWSWSLPHVRLRASPSQHLYQSWMGDKGLKTDFLFFSIVNFSTESDSTPNAAEARQGASGGVDGNSLRGNLKDDGRWSLLKQTQQASC